MGAGPRKAAKVLRDEWKDVSRYRGGRLVYCFLTYLLAPVLCGIPMTQIPAQPSALLDGDGEHRIWIWVLEKEFPSLRHSSLGSIRA